jgi:hypothetical protein
MDGTKCRGDFARKMFLPSREKARHEEGGRAPIPIEAERKVPGHRQFGGSSSPP